MIASMCVLMCINDFVCIDQCVSFILMIGMMNLSKQKNRPMILIGNDKQ